MEGRPSGLPPPVSVDKPIQGAKQPWAISPGAGDLLHRGLLYSNTQRSVLRSQATIPSWSKKSAVSRAAASGESEPWIRFDWM